LRGWLVLGGAENDTLLLTQNVDTRRHVPTFSPSWMILQSAHMMAMAVQKLYKDAQVTIGPWIDRGFYYDFDLKEPLTEKELKQIKKEMQKIARAKLPFIREDVSG